MPGERGGCCAGSVVDHDGAGNRLNCDWGKRCRAREHSGRGHAILRAWLLPRQSRRRAAVAAGTSVPAATSPGASSRSGGVRVVRPARCPVRSRSQDIRVSISATQKLENRLNTQPSRPPTGPPIRAPAWAGRRGHHGSRTGHRRHHHRAVPRLRGARAVIELQWGLRDGALTRPAGPCPGTDSDGWSHPDVTARAPAAGSLGCEAACRRDADVNASRPISLRA